MDEREVETEMQAYAREIDEALRRTPERAARVAELERAVGMAETREEGRAAAEEVGRLLAVAAEEVNAARKAAGRPVPHDGGGPV
jgi:hypothetical protein